MTEKNFENVAIDIAYLMHKRIVIVNSIIIFVRMLGNLNLIIGIIILQKRERKSQVFFAWNASQYSFFQRKE